MYRLSIERRPAPSRFMVFVPPLAAIVLTLLVSATALGLLSLDPWRTLHLLLLSPLQSWHGWDEILLKMCPLVIIALGLSIAFRAGVWNIGADGMFVVGALAAFAIGAQVSGLPAAFQLPLMLLAGAVGGMAWASIPAWLQTRFNASEILVTLMLNYVAVLGLSYLVRGPWKDPSSFNYPQSAMLPVDQMFAPLVENHRTTAAVFICAALVPIVWFLMRATFIGFQVRVAGAAPLAAKYAGFNEARIVWGSLAVSGALAGLAGAVELSGSLGQLTPNITAGYGFTAIIVAFIGRLHPVGIVVSALLLADLRIGSEAGQLTLKLPASLALAFQGLLLFFLLTTEAIAQLRVRLVKETV